MADSILLVTVESSSDVLLSESSVSLLQGPTLSSSESFKSRVGEGGATLATNGTLSDVDGKNGDLCDGK